MIRMSKVRDVAWIGGCVTAMAVVLFVIIAVARLNGLADDNKALGEQNQQLGTDVKHLLKEVRATQKDGSPTIIRLTEIAEQIKSCTDSRPPVGKCYAEGLKRQADSILSINQITVLAVACIDNPGTQTLEEIQSCVLQALPEGKP